MDAACLTHGQTSRAPNGAPLPPAESPAHALLQRLAPSWGRRVRVKPPEREGETVQDIYRCTRCRTGWLAKKVAHSGQGWAVYVFVCSRCRYASQPGVPLAVKGGEGTLLASVRAAIVPVARLTGPGVEALRLEEILTLLGLLPDAPGGEAQRPAPALAGRAAEG